MRANEPTVTVVGYFIDGAHSGLMGATKAALPYAIEALRKQSDTVDTGMAWHLEQFAALLETVHNEVLRRMVKACPDCDETIPHTHGRFQPTPQHERGE
jgi:hypothetical protein